MDQGSTMKRSAVHNFAPTVTKFCVMWEGQALPHDTKFGNSRCEIVGRRVIFIWSLIHGLRWSGLIKAEPGVPDKSSRGLGSMSRYSAQILICFIAYIFSIFQFLCGFGWEPCRTATMHSAPCHCSLLSEWGCSVLIRQSNLPACLAEGQQEETLSGIHATELVKLADKMDEICISGKFSVQEPSKWRFLLHTCE